MLPTNRQTIICKWILKIKYTLFGDVHRYKVKFVVRGFNQILSVDYDDIFPPIVKINSIIVLLALATQHNLEIH
jgi:hypothetical protein